MARLYANENFPLRVVTELRRMGHDVVTVRETGKANNATPDSEILEFERAERRTLLALNRRHFITLHGLNQIMPASWCVRSIRTSQLKRSESMRHWLFMSTWQGSSYG